MKIKLNKAHDFNNFILLEYIINIDIDIDVNNIIDMIDNIFEESQLETIIVTNNITH